MKKGLLIFLLANSMLCFSQKKEMAEAMKNKNYQKVISLGNKLLSENPDDFEINLGMSMVYNGYSDHKNALFYSEKLEKLAQQDWEYCWAFIQLMRAHYEVGNNIVSRGYYDKAKNSKGTQNADAELNYLGRLLGFDKLYDSWRTIETANIIFHFEGSINQDKINEIVKSRQNSFIKINDFFNSKLPKKIDFFVWNSEDSYNSFLNKKLGFANPIYCIAHNRLNQSFGHEIAHNISFWSRNYKKNQTKFINEGIAVCFDMNSDDKFKIAKEVYKIHPIDIKKTWQENLEIDEDILYPISGAFVQYLIKYDKEKFLTLNDNQTYENAKKIYGDKIDSLINDFTATLKE